jgi:rhamnogalacturonyl hydrolase YesR
MKLANAETSPSAGRTAASVWARNEGWILIVLGTLVVLIAAAGTALK